MIYIVIFQTKKKGNIHSILGEEGNKGSNEPYKNWKNIFKNKKTTKSTSQQKNSDT